MRARSVLVVGALAGLVLMTWAGALLTFAREYGCQSGTVCPWWIAQHFRALGVWLLLSVPVMAWGLWWHAHGRSRLPGVLGGASALLSVVVHAMSLWQAQDVPFQLSVFGWLAYALAMLLFEPPAREAGRGADPGLRG